MAATQARRRIVLAGPLLLVPEGLLELARIFGRRAPVVCDIGAARARYFLNVAPQLPQVDFVGIEIVRKRVEKALEKLEAARLRNCRMICGNALQVLRDHIPPGSLAALTLLFPDPWPKKRHAKRRVFGREDTAALFSSALAPGGIIVVKTDSAPYCDAIASALASAPGLQRSDSLEVALPGLAPFSLDRPEETKYEAAFAAEGRAIYRVVFRKVSP